MKLLDLRTLPCPQPVIECRKAVTTENLAELQVILDNEAAVENVTRYLEQQGFITQCTVQGSDFLVKASLDASKPFANDAQMPLNQNEDKTTLAFITTETLGRGDEILGQKLMTTFLSTLEELGPSLWRVILLNGGVKLAAAGDGLESLKKLEAAGVEILVCGTCLAHYDLSKKVGETTNMLDIMTSLQLASKVIRP